MKNRNQAIATIIIVLIIILSAGASAASDAEQLKEMVEYRLTEENAGVGISVAVIEGDNVQFLNFGVVDKTNNLVTTEQHLFEIGSISKTFTSLALASMVEEGKVNLQDPAQKFLPDNVRLPMLEGKPITLMSLANHTSGLPRLPDNMKVADPLDPYADYTVELMYEFLNHHQLTRTVGVKAEYSNLGTGLLGHILGLIDGKSYEQVIAERVLKPLGMGNTFVDVPDEHRKMLSHGHNGQLNQTKYWSIPTLAGAGAIKSNAQDMTRYIQANMATKLPVMMATTQNPTADFMPGIHKIGLGWIIHTLENGKQYYWHNGGTGGFRSYAGFDRDNKRGIVLLSNSIYPLDDIGTAYLSGDIGALLGKSKSEYFVPVTSLEKLVGSYELMPNFVLTVTHDGKRLQIQATGQDKLPVYAKSDTHFFYKVVQAEVTFEVDDEGTAQSLTLHQGGQKLTGKRQ